MGKIVIKERPFKVGDKVWDLQRRDGIVSFVGNDAVYPIRVKFSENSREHCNFTAYGAMLFDDNRTLFHYDVAKEAGLIDMEIEVESEPEFKPEKSNLYYRPESRELLEYISNNEYIGSDGFHVRYFKSEMSNAKEVAEFEGVDLDTTTDAWLNDNGNVTNWVITEKTELIGQKETTVFRLENKDHVISIDVNGKALGLQLKFYRSKFRAERFGK